MKKVFLTLILTMLIIAGCSNEITTTNDKVVVYTTIFPMYDFAKNIGKDKIDLNYIVAPGVEPHDFEITPKTLKDIQNADLLIKNGLGVDAFIDKIESESDLVIVEASNGIEPLHYNDEEFHDEHSHGEFDPHVWLDIDLAIKECENIKNALIEVDSENKEYYEDNYAAYIEKLNELNMDYNNFLSETDKKEIIVAHEAYGYLCKKYNIEQISITGISPNQEPSLSKITYLTKYVKEKNIKYILFDGLVNIKVANTIANEAKIETKTLYSIDGITKADFDNGEDYISLMNKNLETLKLVLK